MGKLVVAKYFSTIFLGKFPPLPPFLKLNGKMSNKSSFFSCSYVFNKLLFLTCGDQHQLFFKGSIALLG